MAVFYGNDAFLILILLTEKRYSSFFEKGFRFTENVFKVKVLKTFKISPDCQLKTLRSPKRKVILKSLG